jgi:hypothetical protein
MLLAAHAAQGHMQVVEASLSLAAYCLDRSRQRFALAEQLVRSVLKVQPEHPMANQMLQALESRPK